MIEGNLDARIYAVKTSCAAKAAVVAEDERENSSRALLNFGHTFGHALEAETGFGSEMLHGEAVAIGMIMALDLREDGLSPADDLDRTTAHFSSTGLPISVSADGDRKDPVALIGHMGHDKVRNGRHVHPCPCHRRRIHARDVDMAVVEDMLRRAIAA